MIYSKRHRSYDPMENHICNFSELVDCLCITAICIFQNSFTACGQIRVLLYHSIWQRWQQLLQGANSSIFRHESRLNIQSLLIKLSIPEKNPFGHEGSCSGRKLICCSGERNGLFFNASKTKLLIVLKNFFFNLPLAWLMLTSRRATNCAFSS